MSHRPFGGFALPLGVRSLSTALEVCRSGELISILSPPFAATSPPFMGEERKKSGELDVKFCLVALGVA